MIGDCWRFLQYSGGSYRNTCTCTYICKVRISTHIINILYVHLYNYYTCTVKQSAFNSEVQMSIGKCIGPINGGKRQRYQVYIHAIYLMIETQLFFFIIFFYRFFLHIYTRFHCWILIGVFSFFAVNKKKKLISLVTGREVDYLINVLCQSWWIYS